MARRLLALAALSLAGCATPAPEAVTASLRGARYVSLGSSFAAGARTGPLVPGSPERCGRAQNNYAQLLAAELDLRLTDVSCGGATTAHLLGPWSELPPQIDAVTADTRIVTLTIGGNDVNYVRNLMIATCGRVPDMMPREGRSCPSPQWPSQADFMALETSLRTALNAIRQRAPEARIIVVEYVRIVPDGKGCDAVPLNEADKAAARDTARRLADATRRAAQAAGVDVLPMNALSQGHEACGDTPWSAGHPGAPASWHPTIAGHAAIAERLSGLLSS